MSNELYRTKTTRSINATAAGLTVVNGTHVDMESFDGVLFIALIGALTATQTTSLKAQQGALSDDSDMADVTGSQTANMADGDSNKCLHVDVFHPQKRYVRPVVVRGTANAVIDGVIAVQYAFKKAPTVQDAATVSKSVAVTG